MARRIVALVRHGAYHQLTDAPSALQPFPLSDKGIKQANQSAQEMKVFLQNNQWQLDTELHSSTLLRAWQTTNIFSELLQSTTEKNITIKCFDDLAERSVGAVANLTVQQIEDLINHDPRYESLPRNWKSNSYFKLPFIGAESLLEAGQRVANHIKQSVADMQSDVDCVKLFVGHGAAYRHAAYELGLLDLQQVEQLSMHHTQPIYLEYCADDTWQHIAGEWKLRFKHSRHQD